MTAVACSKCRPSAARLLGAALLTIAIGDHPDAAVIGLVVVFSTTVGVTESSAKPAADTVGAGTVVVICRLVSPSPMSARTARSRSDSAAGRASFAELSR